MKIRKKENASVTVTLCLTIVVTAALIFSLAEAARFYGVKEDAAEWSHLAAESLAAGYQPYLSKKYDLFLLDGSFLGEEFVKNSTKRGTCFPMYDWENGRSARGKSGNRTGFTKRMQEPC